MRLLCKWGGAKLFLKSFDEFLLGIRVPLEAGVTVILEVCVDTAEGLARAVEGGADRIELCSALALGGLTPSLGLMAQAAKGDVPVMAMIRYRAGDFVIEGPGLEVAVSDIKAARAAGMAGVVIGASLADGRLDEAALAVQVAAARGMDVTLHRCFDLVPDVGEALEVMRRVGIGRVLTSGGAVTVTEGLAQLAQTVALAGPDISVMPGSGVTDTTVHRVLAMGVREVHASGSVTVRQGGRAVMLGFSQAQDRQTDVARVRALKEALGG